MRKDLSFFFLNYLVEDSDMSKRNPWLLKNKCFLVATQTSSYFSCKMAEKGPPLCRNFLIYLHYKVSAIIIILLLQSLYIYFTHHTAHTFLDCYLPAYFSLFFLISYLF